MAEVKKATLYWPDGQKKAVVVGSTEASQLQSRWWWLTPWSYKKPASEIKAEETANMQNGSNEMNDYIDSLPFSDVEKTALKYLARDVYASEKSIISPEESEKMFTTALSEAEKDLTPYYQERSAEELNAYKQSLANLRNEAARYSQQESFSYAQKLQQTKDNLRQRWLTFSWMNRKTLWAEWSMENLGIEWTVPMQRRYDWEDTRANWQQKANTLWWEAERTLGSASISSVDSWNLPDPYWTYNNTWSVTYDPASMQPLYLAKKQGQTWYRSIGDLEKEKMAKLRAEAYNRASSQQQYLK